MISLLLILPISLIRKECFYTRVVEFLLLEYNYTNPRGKRHHDHKTAGNELCNLALYTRATPGPELAIGIRGWHGRHSRNLYKVLSIRYSLMNIVNASNITNIIPELFQENIVRGRGMLARSLFSAGKGDKVKVALVVDETHCIKK